jgi:hypothetical protein
MGNYSYDKPGHPWYETMIRHGASPEKIEGLTSTALLFGNEADSHYVYGWYQRASGENKSSLLTFFKGAGWEIEEGSHAYYRLMGWDDCDSEMETDAQT